MSWLKTFDRFSDIKSGLTKRCQDSNKFCQDMDKNVGIGIDFEIMSGYKRLTIINVKIDQV